MDSNENYKQNTFERERLNYEKGDGTPYLKRAMELDEQMTEEEKKEEDEWWEEFSKDFKIMEADDDINDSDENC